VVTLSDICNGLGDHRTAAAGLGLSLRLFAKAGPKYLNFSQKEIDKAPSRKPKSAVSNLMFSRIVVRENEFGGFDQPFAG
jgi:hypothetical protein